MTYQGTVRNGVVVFETGTKPPDGAQVEVRAHAQRPAEDAGAPAHRKIFDLERYAVETGIPDLALNHDHYLYGHPKVNNGE